MSKTSKFKNLTKTLRKSATNTLDRQVVEKELEAARAAIKAQAEAEDAARIAALKEAELQEKKLQSRIRKQSLESARERSGFEDWAEGGPTTAETLAEINARRAKDFELGRREGAKDINVGLYNALEKLPISGTQRKTLYDEYKNDPNEIRFMSEILGIQHGNKERVLQKKPDSFKPDLKSTGSRQIREKDLEIKDSSLEPIEKDLTEVSRKTSGLRELNESDFNPDFLEKRFKELQSDTTDKKPSGLRELSEETALRNLFKEQDKSSLTRKAAMLSALTGGGLAASSLVSDEAEAGVRGSAAARRKILEKTQNAMDAWTSGGQHAGGARKLRDSLQNQLDLDPTGTAKKEALRRLAARTEVRKNPVTGEHEFKVYRGDSKDRFSESPQSFTTDPNVADAFAQDYNGEVREVWLPASSVGSIPNIMKEGEFLSSEKEVIAKPFKALSRRYTPKEPSIHEKINERAGLSSKKIEPNAEYEGWPEDFEEYADEPSSRKTKKIAGLVAGGLGGAAAAANSAGAADEINNSKSDLESPSEKIIESAPSSNSSFLKKVLSGFETNEKLKEQGIFPVDIDDYLYENLDKYAVQPIKKATLGMLKGKKTPQDERVEYSDIYKQVMDNAGKQRVGQFLKTFAAGAAEDPTGVQQESIYSTKDEDMADAVANAAGAVSDIIEDPIAPLTFGASRLSKARRAMPKIRSFLKK